MREWKRSRQKEGKLCGHLTITITCSPKSEAYCTIVFVRCGIIIYNSTKTPL